MLRCRRDPPSPGLGRQAPAWGTGSCTRRLAPPSWNPGTCCSECGTRRGETGPRSRRGRGTLHARGWRRGSSVRSPPEPWPRHPSPPACPECGSFAQSRQCSRHRPACRTTPSPLDSHVQIYGFHASMTPDPNTINPKLLPSLRHRRKS